MSVLRPVLGLSLVVLAACSAVPQAPKEAMPTSAGIGDVETQAEVVEINRQGEPISKKDPMKDFEGQFDTMEAFDYNAPDSLHETTDITINKDNLVPIMKTVILAYTHKTNPTYKEVLKAGGVSAVKTAFKYFGQEKLATQVLNYAKTFTRFFDDDEFEGDDLKVRSSLSIYINLRGEHLPK